MDILENQSKLGTSERSSLQNIKPILIKSFLAKSLYGGGRARGWEPSSSGFHRDSLAPATPRAPNVPPTAAPFRAWRGLAGKGLQRNPSAPPCPPPAPWDEGSLFTPASAAGFRNRPSGFGPRMSTVSGYRGRRTPQPSPPPFKSRDDSYIKVWYSPKFNNLIRKELIYLRGLKNDTT